MEKENEALTKTTREDFAGWNCLLTILGFNLVLFIIATYFSQCN